jgi:hypothetical protein
MTALALGGEHPAFPDPQILHLQTQDLAAAQPIEHHRRHHGLVSVGVQHRCPCIDLDRRRDPRQPPGPVSQRHPQPGTTSMSGRTKRPDCRRAGDEGRCSSTGRAEPRMPASQRCGQPGSLGGSGSSREPGRAHPSSIDGLEGAGCRKDPGEELPYVQRWATGSTCTAGRSVRPTRRPRSSRFGDGMGRPPYLVRHADGHEALVSFRSGRVGAVPEEPPTHLKPPPSPTVFETRRPPKASFSLLPQPRCCPCPPSKQPGSRALPPARTQPDTPARRHRMEITRWPRTAMSANGPWRATHSHPDRSLLHECAHRGALRPIRSTTPATTLASRRSPSLDPHSRTATVRPTANASRQLSTVMTATLSAELEGRVPADLVADIVRTVLDESRQAAHDWGVQPTMIEARQRLERLIRAGSSH